LVAALLALPIVILTLSRNEEPAVLVSCRDHTSRASIG
jgi:hypothetical protein